MGKGDRITVTVKLVIKEGPIPKIHNKSPDAMDRGGEQDLQRDSLQCIDLSFLNAKPSQDIIDSKT